jgi:hypothetical protein
VRLLAWMRAQHVRLAPVIVAAVERARAPLARSNEALQAAKDLIALVPRPANSPFPIGTVLDLIPGALPGVRRPGVTLPSLPKRPPKKRPGL